MNTKSAKINKTGDGISAEGARVLGKALLVNTTLTSLNLAGESQRKNKPNNEIAPMKKTKTGNKVRGEGACALGEALKINSTLKALDLESLKQVQVN